MNAFAARATRLNAVASDVAHIAVEIKSIKVSRRLESEVVVEVHAAGLNPSDPKAAIGFMPHAGVLSNLFKVLSLILF
jgi:NADPH2:quinone reductase